MISVAIVGLGNVSSHLYNAFKTTGTVHVAQYSSRDLENISKVDVVIIAVSDDAIVEVSTKIEASLVTHTSGSVHISSLNTKGNKGVFYPLQTFTKDKNIDFKNIPICIEAENKKDLQLLERLASIISDQVFHINSEQRSSLHISAVFVNNFVNHMYVIAEDICKQHSVPFEVLQPLIRETSEKILSISPKEAQTGPAKRNDIQTIQKHLHLLNEQQKELYSKLTQSIQSYGKKL
jgi:predicted short-subunit dehydrogenase-like oxidoreductase (DUF2520 family)